MASRIQLMLSIDQGNLGGRRELAGTFAAYIYESFTALAPVLSCYHSFSLTHSIFDVKLDMLEGEQ